MTGATMWKQLAVSIASLGLVLPVLSCSEPAGAKTAAPQSNRFIVGIDLSESRSVEALRDSRRLLDDLVESRLHNGDELVLLEMYGTSDNGDHQWIDSVPRLRRPDARKNQNSSSIVAVGRSRNLPGRFAGQAACRAGEFVR